MKVGNLLDFLTDDDLDALKSVGWLSDEDLIKEYIEYVQNTDTELAVSENLSLLERVNIDKLTVLAKTDESIRFLIKGYLEYAEYVLLNRSVPSIYDGLKPVQRLAVWHLRNQKGRVKSTSIVGSIVEDHPHGDSSVYDAVVRMTDLNGSFMIPLVSGEGNFGRYYLKGGVAAMRYTNIGASEYLKYMLTAQDVIKNKLSYDGKNEIPTVLTPSFPYVLTASSATGIGVGTSTKIPTYHPNDVADLIIEYIKTGDMQSIIAPEFVSPSLMLKNRLEFKKILETGRGKVLLRAHTEIDKNKINITSLPEGVTTSKVIKEVNDLREQYPDIKSISELSDKNGVRMSVQLKRGANAEQLLGVLYTKTSLEVNYSSHILVEKDKELLFTGVYGIIREWVAWRRKVLKLQQKLRLNDCLINIAKLKPFVALLDNQELLSQLILTLRNEGQRQGIELLVKELDCTDEDAKRICSFSLSSLSKDNNKPRMQLEKEQSNMEYLSSRLTDSAIDEMIVEDMIDLKNNIGNKIPRRMEETMKKYNIVYKQEDSESSVSELISPFAPANNSDTAFYVLDKNNRVTKLTSKPIGFEEELENGGFLNGFEGNVNDVLIGVTNYGDVIRIYTDEMEYSYANAFKAEGYSGLPNDAKIIILERLEESEYLFVFSDGFISYFNPVEFKPNKARTRVLRGQLNNKVHSSLVGFIKLDKPYTDLNLLVHFNGNLEAVYELSNLSHKSSKGATRLPNSKDLIIEGFNLVERDLAYIMLNENQEVNVYGYILDNPTHVDGTFLLNNSDLRALRNSFNNNEVDTKETEEFTEPN